MNRPQIAAFRPGAAFGLRSFIVRVVLIAGVLAVPILGTSYVLVSRVTNDIAMATGEHQTLTNFAHIVEVFERVERFNDVSARHANAGVLATARADVARTLATARHAYTPGAPDPVAERFWTRLTIRWQRAAHEPTAANRESVIEALRDCGNELEDDNPLDRDPSSAVQYIADTILRREPRSVVALRQTGVAVAAASGARLSIHAAERIASRRALENQSLSDGFYNLGFAISLDRSLPDRLSKAMATAKVATAVYERRVDTLLSTLDDNPANSAAIAASARAAVVAHFAVWNASREIADRLVLARLAREFVIRRIVVGFAFLAVLAGTIAVTLAGRYEARRDKIELEAAKLEGENLRAELARVSVERALRLQEAQFRTVFENADLGIAVFEPSGHVLQHNSAVREMLGPATQSILAAQRSTIGSFASAFHEPFTRDESRETADGRPQWLSFTYSGVYDEGVCQMIILLLRDATEEKLHAAQLAHDASHDSLTGLANRASIERALRGVVTEDRPRTPFALMYIDLDQFKPINDTFGHHAGDHVLTTVAQRLRSLVASTDMCARLGGDEFAVLLRGIEDRATIESIARRIGASIALPIPFDDDVELLVTASIGISIGCASSTSSDALKRDADAAMYAAKQRGRDRYVISEPQLHVWTKS